MCLDSDNSWEWGNYNEIDGSADNSLLTSYVTDGIYETSPSADELIDINNPFKSPVIPIVWPSQKKYPEITNTENCNLCLDVVMKVEKTLSNVNCDLDLSKVCKETIFNPLAPLYDDMLRFARVMGFKTDCVDFSAQYCPAIKEIMKTNSADKICKKASFC